MSSVGDNCMLDNPKYRQYMSAIDKALRSFESSSEWADLISALGKLNKVLNPKFKIIPKKITIGKRLAQCMHPALPGGVHLKALDVYNSIFKIIETDRLKTDLYIYAMGVFPLLANASMQVKPVLLNLYETHFLPLDAALCSCLDGMLLGLLPGLEEGTEHFQRTDALLDRVCEKVGKFEFFAAVWRCVLSSSLVRLFAVQLIIRRFDRAKSTDDQLYIIGSDVFVMVRALRESLQDNSVLTQRASLDVLILCCPLSNIPISRHDCCELLLAALQCLLRRDMSLNRRLYSWLLGHDLVKRVSSTGGADHDNRETYFDVYSKELLTDAILQILISQRKKIADCEATKQVSVLEELYPFRILISLLDKAEIGPVVIEALLLDVFRLLKAAVDFVTRKYGCSKASANDEGVDNKAARLSEISKTANLLLGVFESGYIWQFLSYQLHQSKTQKRDSRDENDDTRQPTTSYAEVCNLTCLLLRIVNVDSYQEIQTCHLPNLLYDIISLLVNSLPQFSIEELKLGLETCNVLLDLIQPVQSDEIASSMNEAKSEPVTQSSSKETLLSNSRNPAIQRDVSQCSDLFNEYFCKLVELRLSCDRDSINLCVANLEIQENNQDPGDPKPLQKKHESSSIPSHQPCTDDVRKCLKYTNQTELVEIFKLTCQLLLDFACFPLFCNGQSYPSSDEREKKVSISRFPRWLKCLLWCICDCYSPVTTFFEIPSTSVSTMLDLISLATSVARKKRPSKQDDSCAGTVSVVVLSPMSYAHVCVLTGKTRFYQHVTEKLWQIMADSKSCGHHLTCVQLMIRLHSMCPDDRCENVLLEYILHSDKNVRIKALAQFCRFWHFTKTLLSKKVTLQTGGNFRNFNRCLFAVIDSLSLNNNPSYILSPLFHLNDGGTSVATSVASSWLHQCLEERDLVRILEPLLMVALHPRTHSSQLRPPEGTDVSSLAEKSAGNKEDQNGGGFSSNSRAKLGQSSDESIHNITSNVMLEIAKGKEHYKELISSLTSLNHKETAEQQLDLRVNKIVNDVIQSAVEQVTLEKPTEECKEDDAESVSSDVILPDTSTLQPVLDDNLDTFSTFHSVKNFSKVKSDKHMLVYQENFDSARALYTLRSISTLLHAHPRLFTYAAVTSQLSSYTSQLAGGGLLQDLLSRHLQVLSGRSFYEDVASRSQSMMVIDVLVVVCLHFIRSWHPEDTISPESLHDIRCSASSLLCSLLSQITEFTRETLSFSSNVTSSPMASSIGVTSQHIGPFVRSVLSKYSVSEIVLASLATTVEALNMLDHDDSDSLEPRRVKVARASVTSLNDVELAFWWSGNEVARVRSFQCHLLALVRALVVLEHLLTDTDISSVKDFTNDSKHSQLTATTYQFVGSVATQPLLTTSLIRMLRLQSACEVHPAWLDFLTSSLTYLARALPELTAPVTSQLCKNLEFGSSLYITWDDNRNASATALMPPDYMAMLLKSLKTLTHFTLLLQSGSGLQHTTSPAVSHLSKMDRVSVSSASTNSSQASNNTAFSAIGTLLNVFTNNNSLKAQRSIEEQVLSADWIETRRTTLRNLPRILSCLAVVWAKVVSSKSSSITGRKKQSLGNVNPCVALGDSETVSQNVLQILDPLSVQYGENLLSAFAIVWERRGRGSPKHQDAQPEHPLSEQQIQLLNIACSIRALHCDVTLTLVKRVIVQPPEFPSLGPGKKKKIPFEEYLIDFSLHFLQRQTAGALRESWSSLLSLLRECIAFGPVGTPTGSNSNSSSSGSNPSSTGKRVLTARSYFLLLLIVAEYVKRVPPFDDKKDQKDLQEICVKCIEACNTIVDRSLEHGGWLARRAPLVLPGPQPTAAAFTHHKHHVPEGGSSLEGLVDHHSKDRDQVQIKSVASDPVLPSKNDPPDSLPLPAAVLPQTFNQHYNSSVQALNVLSQVLANLLDVIYGSEEKDKSVPVLTPVMTNVTPYLRNHSLKSVPSYKAAVCFLSSISGYQQTRRAWKRDAFELFLASDFFQMPMESVSEWRNIVDHLMTHDSTTFKDLMVRIGLTRNAATGTSLNIFSNKEQELEQRAMLLKRLAFVIFSSGLNQYQRHLPEIQERMSESLRLHQVPVVQEQVFLCFRVLLLRVSPNHLTSLWPSIITELVQVMGQMEQELLHYDLEKTVVDNESGASPKPNKSNAGTPTSGVGIIFNSAASPSSINNQQKWLAMYLSACKLLDLTLLLQPSQLTHFKMFRWSFVGEPGEVTDDAYSTNDVITPSSRATSAPDVSGNDAEQEIEESESSSSNMFVPHCVRIKRLLADKAPNGRFDALDVAPARPLLKRRRMSSLFQLQAFFNTIVSPSTMLSMHQSKAAVVHSSVTEKRTTSSPTIEKLLERDFVEFVPS